MVIPVGNVAARPDDVSCCSVRRSLIVEHQRPVVRADPKRVEDLSNIRVLGKQVAAIARVNADG